MNRLLSLFENLLPYTQVIIALPIEPREAQFNLSEKLEQTIVLRRSWYRKLTYEGSCSGQQFLLIGPRGRRRWCLHTRGQIDFKRGLTILRLTIHLSLLQMLLVLPFAVVLGGITLRAGAEFLPIYLTQLAWLYLAILLAFHLEVSLVKKLLTRIALGQPLEGLI